MPVTKRSELLGDDAGLRHVDATYRNNLLLVRSRGLSTLGRKEVIRDGLTMKDLFKRVGLNSAQVAAALPTADSTIRAFITGRKEPGLPLSAQERLMEQLRVDWPGFVAAYKNSCEARGSNPAKLKSEVEELELAVLAAR